MSRNDRDEIAPLSTKLPSPALNPKISGRYVVGDDYNRGYFAAVAVNGALRTKMVQFLMGGAYEIRRADTPQYDARGAVDALWADTHQRLIDDTDGCLATYNAKEKIVVDLDGLLVVLVEAYRQDLRRFKCVRDDKHGEVDELKGTHWS